MCVVAVGPASRIIPHVSAAMETNRDGAGLAWYDGKKLCYIKGINSPKHARRILRKIGEGSAAFHARIATSGSKSPVLTHPFHVERFSPLAYHGETDMLLFHNGISRFPWETLIPAGRAAKEWSDTRALAHGLATGAVRESDLESDGGKFLIFRSYPGGAGFRFFGNWTEFDGVRWSNLFWRWTLRRDDIKAGIGWNWQGWESMGWRSSVD